MSQSHNTNFSSTFSGYAFPYQMNETAESWQSAELPAWYAILGYPFPLPELPELPELSGDGMLNDELADNGSVTFEPAPQNEHHLNVRRFEDETPVEEPYQDMIGEAWHQERFLDMGNDEVWDLERYMEMGDHSLFQDSCLNNGDEASFLEPIQDMEFEQTPMEDMGSEPAAVEAEPWGPNPPLDIAQLPTPAITPGEQLRGGPPQPLQEQLPHLVAQGVDTALPSVDSLNLARRRELKEKRRRKKAQKPRRRPAAEASAAAAAAAADQAT